MQVCSRGGPCNSHRQLQAGACGQRARIEMRQRPQASDLDATTAASVVWPTVCPASSVLMPPDGKEKLHAYEMRKAAHPTKQEVRQSSPGQQSAQDNASVRLPNILNRMMAARKPCRGKGGARVALSCHHTTTSHSTACVTLGVHVTMSCSAAACNVRSAQLQPSYSQPSPCPSCCRPREPAQFSVQPAVLPISAVMHDCTQESKK